MLNRKKVITSVKSSRDKLYKVDQISALFFIMLTYQSTKFKNILFKNELNFKHLDSKIVILSRQSFFS